MVSLDKIEAREAADAARMTTPLQTEPQAPVEERPDTLAGRLETYAGEAEAVAARLMRKAAAELTRLRRQVEGMRQELDACEQAAGKALGYPWFKDDQKNFPGATEDNGVCIGEHVASTIVEELASRFTRAQSAEARLAVVTEALREIAKGEAPPERHGHYLAHREAVRIARQALSESRDGEQGEGLKPPVNYLRLPDGEVCKCLGLWQERNGAYWCCGGAAWSPDSGKDEGR